MKLRDVALLAGVLWLSFSTHQGPPRADESLMPDASRLVGTDRITLNGRPTDIVLLNVETAIVKDEKGLTVYSLKERKVLSRVALDGGTSPIGLVRSSSGKVWVTNAKGSLVSFDPAANTLGEPVDLAGKYPCGMALNASGDRAFVALSVSNEVVEVDLSSGTVLRRIKTGPAPFALALDESAQQLFVSEQGTAGSGPLSATSAGTAVAIDARGVATAGTLSQIDLKSGKVVRRVSTGRQPQGMVWDAKRKRCYLVCSNDDSLVSFNPQSGRVTTTRLGKGVWGAMPTGLALDDDSLLVTLAGRNEVWKLNLSSPDRPKPVGFWPTDWYPVAIVSEKGRIVVANLKGLGSRNRSRPAEQGLNSYDYLGSISLLDEKDLISSDSPSESLADKSTLPKIRHVVYVIKENRTFDQVMGDLKKGDADPKLCIFGEKVTPNQHAIATQFVTLDNYYCSGVLSADGHSWATEGNVTPYLERSFGGFERSYPFGDDPLTYSSSGFLWDGLLAKGLTFRNYGEFDYAEPKGKLKGRELYIESLKPDSALELSHNIGVGRVREHSSPDYPGWNMDISDQYRINIFEREFREFVKKGTLPNLIVVYLPQDHTGGPASPRAHVADNDLALGRLLEMLSHSPFWKDMAVFVTEDDPQDGFDHVDGHRSTCLVAGPNVRRGEVETSFFTQASVLRTICEIFGAKPMNLKVSQAPSLAPCFTRIADPRPFNKLKGEIALDEPQPTAVGYRKLVAGLDLSRREVQTKAEMDHLNRAVWMSVRGGQPYPAEWAGAHGRGLHARGLTVVTEEPDEDD